MTGERGAARFAGNDAHEKRPTAVQSNPVQIFDGAHNQSIASSPVALLGSADKLATPVDNVPVCDPPASLPAHAPGPDTAHNQSIAPSPVALVGSADTLASPVDNVPVRDPPAFPACSCA